MIEECWTIAQVAEHLGVSEDAARKQLSRWRIRGERHYPAGFVIACHAARPGQGARTDLSRCVGCGGAGPTDDFCDTCAGSVVLAPPDDEPDKTL